MADPLSPADAGAAFLADIVAAGPAGLRVKAGLLIARPDGDFDLVLDSVVPTVDGPTITRKPADVPLPRHTVRGAVAGPDGWPYGTNHDMDCPGCVGTSFTASARSDAYWSS